MATEDRLTRLERGVDIMVEVARHADKRTRPSMREALKAARIDVPTLSAGELRGLQNDANPNVAALARKSV